MYGKHFASMYEGSMYGIGAVPLAVWGYVISHMDEEGHLELNPALLAGMIGEREDEIQAAIDLFQQPDPSSRCKEEEGRRLVRVGQFAYRVPSAPEYRKIWNRETQKEYNRVRMREWRAKKKLEEEAEARAADNGGKPKAGERVGPPTVAPEKGGEAGPAAALEVEAAIERAPPDRRQTLEAAQKTGKTESSLPERPEGVDEDGVIQNVVDDYPGD